MAVSPSLRVCGCIARVRSCALPSELVNRARGSDPVVFGSDALGRSHVVHILPLASDVLPPGLLMLSPLLGSTSASVTACLITPLVVSPHPWLSGSTKWGPAVHVWSLTL